MPSLMATLGLNNSSFQSKLAESKTQARAAGQQIQKELNGGSSGGGSGHGNAGAWREAMILVREIARGDFKRAAGSASILFQQLRNIGSLGVIINPITATIAGLAAGLLAAWKFSGALVEKLSGLKVPDFRPEYIAKHLQKANQAAEAQKEINREIQKTEELYDSAAKTAERFAGVLKDHFDHQRKMNDLNMQKELALAKTEQQRQAIRKKFSDAELAINARERDEAVRNKVKERADLEDEAVKRKKQGDAINVNSKEHDQQLLENKKKMADEAQKYLDDLNNPSLGQKAKNSAISGFNKVALSGVSGNDLAAAEAANRAEAQRRIQAFKDQVDTNATNDEQRKQKDELYKGAAQSAAKAAELGKSIPDMIRENRIRNQNESQEAAAKLAAETAGDQARGRGGRPDVNALQRIGAYIGGRDPKDDLIRQGNRSLQKLEQYMQTIVNRQSGGTQF